MAKACELNPGVDLLTFKYMKRGKRSSLEWSFETLKYKEHYYLTQKTELGKNIELKIKSETLGKIGKDRKQ
jgi:hypothetical protein